MSRPRNGLFHKNKP